jgi:hypothetical protein
MLIALAVLAALEAAPPPVAAVALILSGAPGAPVNAAPRTLSDVARERGWPGGAPRRRPHVSHFARPSALPAPNAGHGPASRAGAGPVSLPATHAEGIAMRGATRRP